MRYIFSKKTVIEKYGVSMFEIQDVNMKICGYSELIFDIPIKVNLLPSTDTFIFKESVIRGGEIRGGEIRGGVIWGGEIRGGVIRGGVIWGGEIRGGEIWGGVIRGGEIWGGEICGGEIRGGVIWGGEICGGEIRGGVIWGGEICGGVILGGEIRGGVIKSTLIQIQGTKHFVSIDFFGTNEIKLNIGCNSYTIDFWKENYKNIGNSKKYSENQINEYYEYILLFEKMYFTK